MLMHLIKLIMFGFGCESDTGACLAVYSAAAFSWGNQYICKYQLQLTSFLLYLAWKPLKLKQMFDKIDTTWVISTN